MFASLRIADPADANPCDWLWKLVAFEMIRNTDPSSSSNERKTGVSVAYVLK